MKTAASIQAKYQFVKRFLALIVLINLAAPPSLFSVAVQADAAPAVVMNELFWTGSSLSSADEWIELRNTTSQAVDISNWRLMKKSGSADALMVQLPANSVIPAAGLFVVSNYAIGNASTTLAVTPNVVNTDVALVNSALQIKLLDAVGTLIDVADDGAGNPLAGKLSAGDHIYASMERNLMPGDGTVASNWHTASRSVGFIPGAVELGTPGTQNSNALPVADAGADGTSRVGEAMNFDGSNSLDPEGTPLTYAWDFGDGATANTSAPTHVFSSPGTFTVTLTVSDGIDQATDTAQQVVTAGTTTQPVNTNTPSAVLPNANTSTPTSSCRGAQLSELFPNPAGVDDAEFIELYNPTTKTVSLANCSLWVNEKRRYQFQTDTIAGKSFLVLEKSISKLSLTNDTGTVRLEDVNGSTLDQQTYPKSQEDESWSRLGAEWSWTNRVTKGIANQSPVDVEALDNAQVVIGQNPSNTNIEVQPIPSNVADIQTYESGQVIMIRAQVTVCADVLGTRLVFVQDPSGAIEALIAEDAPHPLLGDTVEITGTVRIYQGRKRLSAKADGIKILAPGKLDDPKKISLDQLSPDMADQLVRVTGVVSTNSSTKFTIDDGSDEGEIYIKSSTGIVKPKLVAGDRVTVDGVVGVSTAGVRILPRSIEDIHVEHVLGASIVATMNTNATPALPTASVHQTLWYWLAVGVGVLAATGKALWSARQRNQKPPLERAAVSG